MRLFPLFLRSSIEWATPPGLLNRLSEEFGFDDDPCPPGALDGLARPWGRRVFCNPPYSRTAEFLEKGCVEIAAGRTDVAVFLIPARTDTGWFHEIALPYGEIRFVRGRVPFERIGSRSEERSRSPFPSMVVILRPRRASTLGYPAPKATDLA